MGCTSSRDVAPETSSSSAVLHLSDYYRSPGGSTSSLNRGLLGLFQETILPQTRLSREKELTNDAVQQSVGRQIAGSQSSSSSSLPMRFEPPCTNSCRPPPAPRMKRRVIHDFSIGCETVKLSSVDQKSEDLDEFNTVRQINYDVVQ